ncbi:protein of unknown function [Nitrospira defluvii]|uniref:Uncharacterized protein n=1 Tax=Nitrospira defluvii TaxID=330214 RepID=D8P9Q9_9BACT|nr:protein of unknown function [Nitrospira defluvii]
MLREWFNPAVTDLFLRFAIEHPQDRMQSVKIDGPEGRCHEVCLTHCTHHADLLPWFGFVLLEENGETRWWLHSRATTADLGTRLENDPTFSHSTRYIGTLWSRELFRAITRKPGAAVPDPLPEVFRRSVHEQPTSKEGRRWVESRQSTLPAEKI